MNENIQTQSIKSQKDFTTDSTKHNPESNSQSQLDKNVKKINADDYNSVFGAGSGGHRKKIGKL